MRGVNATTKTADITALVSKPSSELFLRTLILRWQRNTVWGRLLKTAVLPAASRGYRWPGSKRPQLPPSGHGVLLLKGNGDPRMPTLHQLMTELSCSEFRWWWMGSGKLFLRDSSESRTVRDTFSHFTLHVHILVCYMHVTYCMLQVTRRSSFMALVTHKL